MRHIPPRMGTFQQAPGPNPHAGPPVHAPPPPEVRGGVVVLPPKAPVSPTVYASALPEIVLPICAGPTIYAITSLAPGEANRTKQIASIQSWQQAGCKVVAVQGPSEHWNGTEWPGVIFATANVSTYYAGAFIPISSLAAWATRNASPQDSIFLVNADCSLAIGKDVMGSLAARCADGLCYFVRHDVGPGQESLRHSCGVDGFLFRADLSSVVRPTEGLCMGKPWWDWIVPMAFKNAGRTLYNPSFMSLSHQLHAQRWSNEDWMMARASAARAYAIDLARFTGEMRAEIASVTHSIRLER